MPTNFGLNKQIYFVDFTVQFQFVKAVRDLGQALTVLCCRSLGGSLRDILPRYVSQCYWYLLQLLWRQRRECLSFARLSLLLYNRGKRNHQHRNLSCRGPRGPRHAQLNFPPRTLSSVCVSVAGTKRTRGGTDMRVAVVRLDPVLGLVLAKLPLTLLTGSHTAQHFPPRDPPKGIPWVWRHMRGFLKSRCDSHAPSLNKFTSFGESFPQSPPIICKAPTANRQRRWASYPTRWSRATLDCVATSRGKTIIFNQLHIVSHSWSGISQEKYIFNHPQ